MDHFLRNYYIYESILKKKYIKPILSYAYIYHRMVSLFYHSNRINKHWDLILNIASNLDCNSSLYFIDP